MVWKRIRLWWLKRGAVKSLKEIAKYIKESKDPDLPEEAYGVKKEFLDLLLIINSGRKNLAPRESTEFLRLANQTIIKIKSIRKKLDNYSFIIDRIRIIRTHIEGAIKGNPNDLNAGLHFLRQLDITISKEIDQEVYKQKRKEEAEKKRIGELGFDGGIFGKCNVSYSKIIRERYGLMWKKLRNSRRYDALHEKLRVTFVRMDKLPKHDDKLEAALKGLYASLEDIREGKTRDLTSAIRYARQAIKYI